MLTNDRKIAMLTGDYRPHMFAKLFASLYQGTLRGRAHEILVFTNLLAHCDAEGNVDKHFKAIAEEVGLTIDEVKKAIEVLEAPDSESRSPELDGRRLVRADEHRAWGWRVVNHGKYRRIRDEADRREQNRLAQARFRERSASVSNSKPRKPPSAHTEADTEYTNKEGESRRLHSIPSTVEEVISYGATLNPKVDETRCRGFWAHYEGQRRTNASGDIFWITSGEVVVTNWKAKLPSWEGKKANAAHRDNNRPGADRSAGTFNEGKAHLYRDIGKVGKVG